MKAHIPGQADDGFQGMASKASYHGFSLSLPGPDPLPVQRTQGWLRR